MKTRNFASAAKNHPDKLTMILGLFTLLLFVKNATASAIYTFEGSVTDYGIYTTQEDIDHYQAYPFAPGSTMQFSVSLDDSRLGSKTDPYGTTTILPYRDGSDLLYDKNFWEHNRNYADLLSSTIDFSVTGSQREYNYVSDYRYDDIFYGESGYEGIINVGETLTISKTGVWGDTSVFAENWSLGEQVSFNSFFNDGYSGGAIEFNGSLTLVNIEGSFKMSTDLPPPPIPIPSTIWLFGSGLLGLVSFARKRQK